MTAAHNTWIGREQVVRETEKAVCVAVTRSSGGVHIRDMAQLENVSQVWLPKRHAEWKPVMAYGEMLHVPAWLALEKGL